MVYSSRAYPFIFTLFYFMCVYVYNERYEDERHNSQIHIEKRLSHLKDVLRVFTFVLLISSWMYHPTEMTGSYIVLLILQIVLLVLLRIDVFLNDFSLLLYVILLYI